MSTNIVELALASVADGGACYLPAGQRQSLAGRGLLPVRGAPVHTRQLSLVSHPDASQRETIEALARRFSGLRL